MFMRNRFTRFIGALSALALSVGGMITAPAVPAAAAYNGSLPGSVMLGMFFNSEEDRTDTLYVSFDGLNFHKISQAFTDTTPYDASSSIDQQYGRDNANTLHDPGLQYDKARDIFWTNSAWTDNGSLIPMISYSRDLITWTAPGSASQTNVRGFVGDLPFDANGNRTNSSNFSCAAPEIFVDDDGSVWFTACLGFYANNDADKMSTYILRANNFQVRDTDITASTRYDYRLTNYQVHANYSPMYSIDLDSAKTSKKDPANEPDLLKTDNYIDSSLFKDPDSGKYYLTVKRDGVCNEIWESDTLLSLQGQWNLVTYDALTGYEGPSLTKSNGHYYLYADKLADYPALDPDGNFGTGDGTRGIYVCTSDDLIHWSNPQKINATSENGSAIPTRHGTVITVTDPSAIRTVMNAYSAAGYNYSPSQSTPYAAPASTYQGWKHIGGRMFWYENNVRQGTYQDNGDVVSDGTKRGREVAQISNNTWYWLDANMDGAKAAGKEVMIPYIYQQEAGWDDATMRANASASDAGLQDFVYESMKNRTGKWIRYDGNGGMLKGWQTIQGDLATIYPEQRGNTYYYDTKTGLMAKGWVTIDGVRHHFDEITGVQTQ